MIIDRISPHDGSNEFCQDCEQQIDHCICPAAAGPEEEQNNLPAVPVLAEPSCNDLLKTAERTTGDARESTPKAAATFALRDKADSRGGGQTLSDDWEVIAAQLDYWRDMDMQYWEQRKEREYSAWLDRRIKSRIAKGAK